METSHVFFIPIMIRLPFYMLMAIIMACHTSSSRDGYISQPKPHLADSVMKYVAIKDDVIALTNAQIIDGTGSAPKRGYTVVIQGRLIKSVGPTGNVAIPDKARHIDCTGKTIIPGIVGMHNHLHVPGNIFTGDIATKFYLAAGVTTIQTCGSAAPEQELALATAIRQGKAVGPAIIPSGPYINGPGGSGAMFIPTDSDTIGKFINHWVNEGVRWFKVYRQITPSALSTVINEAHSLGAKVTGHLCSITFEEAVRFGIDGIEHGFNSMSDFRNDKNDGQCSGSREYIDTLNISGDEVRRIQQLMIDKRVHMTSTLAIYEASIAHRVSSDATSLRLMSEAMYQEFIQRHHDGRATFDSIRQKRLQRIMKFEKQFVEQGGLLIAGVDAGRHVLPGFGDLRNYQLLIEAGFLPEEAIKIMSLNGARVLDNEHIGSIREGKFADLVVIEGELMASPDNIHAIEMVFKDGYGYAPELLLKDLTGTYGNW